MPKRILQQRGTGNDRMFLVEWVGPDYDCTWESDENIEKTLLTSWFKDYTLEGKVRKKVKKTLPTLTLMRVQTMVNKMCALVKKHLPLPALNKKNNSFSMVQEEIPVNISCVSDFVLPEYETYLHINI